MKEINNLPQGWKNIQLNNLGNFLTGVTYKKGDASKEPKEGFLPVLRANNINKDLNFDDLVYVPREKIKEEQLIRKHDIVICMSSGSKHLVGKSAQAESDFDGGFGAFCGLFRCHQEINEKYVGYFFQSPKYRNRVSEVSQGININNLRRAHIESMEISLAPLPEQKRIVSKIEELFTQLDAGVAELQKAKAQLKRYRQAVLKAAVEGKLTRVWREAHQDVLEPASELFDRILTERRAKWEEEELAKMRTKGKEPKDDKWKRKYKEPEKPNLDGLLKLPEGWIWGNVGQIGKVSGGLTKNRKRNNFPLTLPYLSVANAYANELRLDNVKTVGIKENELKRILLEKGDLLIVEGNGSIQQIGRVVIWDGSISPCVHQNHLIKIRFNPLELGKFVLFWLLSNAGREQIMIVASSTSGLYTLSISKVSALSVPIPPIMEQMRIVEKIERRISVAEEIEHQLDQGLMRAERLRQSILKHAFDGKLVPQDPNDEPASELLDRVKKEKVQVGRNKKTTNSTEQKQLKLLIETKDSWDEGL